MESLWKALGRCQGLFSKLEHLSRNTFESLLEALLEDLGVLLGWNLRGIISWKAHQGEFRYLGHVLRASWRRLWETSWRLEGSQHSNT